MLDMWDNGTVTPIKTQYLFPSWGRVWMGSYDVQLCLTADCGAAGETIKAVTVVNFGTATSADIKTVYWQARCDVTTTGLLSMSYAGSYTGDSGTYPAWTWAGTSPAFTACADLCGTPACGGYFIVDIYVDIASCPTELATVNMGFASADAYTTGSITDNVACQMQYYDVQGPSYAINLSYKEGPDFAAPGDTVWYTIYYGKPGSAAMSDITIMDTMPPYTHYVGGSASPAPEGGWDPNPGPPLKLRWKISPVVGNPPAWGPTGMVTFALSVDWGNGESFEAGSGNVAAPEGARLNNRAQLFFNGTNCPSDNTITQPATTVVRRFLFYMIGDNDLLFAPLIGMSDDEIIYDIFIKNMSDEKTWWDVHVWDTVPTELDAWGINCGFEDPCTGWTMTPSGCASGGPGSVVSGPATLLTWKLDMPPGYTIDLRWKAVVKGSTSPNSTALNRISMLAYGRTRIVNGTGYSGKPRNFTHYAPIILRTTYNSYLSYAASGMDEDAGCPGGIFIDFFPLNKMTNFELRKLEYQGNGNCGPGSGTFAGDGGVSASINFPVGTCLGGYSEGGTPGCKAERAPSMYYPNQWSAVAPMFPAHFLYKVTSNSPVLWQMMRWLMDQEDLGSTFIPSTANSFCGWTLYTYVRPCPWGCDASAGYGDVLNIVNTDSTTTTTVHIFRWDDVNLTYAYWMTGELDVESEWMPFDITRVNDGNYFKIISSDGKLVARQTTSTDTADWGTSFPYFTFNDVAPTRDTGNLTSKAGNGPVFYTFIRHANTRQLVVGNVGTTDATYEIFRYVPEKSVLVGRIPPTVSGTSGKWVSLGIDSVLAGMNPSGNAHIYGSAYDNKLASGKAYMTLYKVAQKSGGGIQVVGGYFDHRGGGQVLNASDGEPAGTEFWLHGPYWSGDPSGCFWRCGASNPCGTTSPFSIDLISPKANTAVRCVTNDGYSATYTTTGPDQCVAFRMITLPTTAGEKRNYRINVLTGTKGICLYTHCCWHHKFFSAPFLATGVFYQIISPPVVYLGQNFWITIIVKDVGGGTKDDYAGTTSFTSTDPGAKIEGKAMDTYNYTWNGCGTNCGVRVFVNVSMTRLGLQTIIARDTLDGSITGLGTVMVVAADVKLEKRKKLTVAASGDTVQFQICWSNNSVATAFSFTITDAVPMGTSYVPEVASTMLCGSSAPVPGITVWYSTATTTTPPGTFTSLPGTGSPLANTRWLRWTIRDVYVNSSGCVCFKVSVN